MSILYTMSVQNLDENAEIPITIFPPTIGPAPTHPQAVKLLTYLSSPDNNILFKYYDTSVYDNVGIVAGGLIFSNIELMNEWITQYKITDSLLLEDLTVWKTSKNIEYVFQYCEIPDGTFDYKTAIETFTKTSCSGLF